MLGQLALIGLVVLLGLPGLSTRWPADPIGWLALWAGAMALLLAGGMIILAFRELGDSLTPMPRPREDAELVDSGIYARLRHPIYAGVILAALGWSALAGSLPALGVTILLALFLDAKARREEDWLADRYPAYLAYRDRTKRFLPGVY